jgi:hypothetical protein
MRILQMVRIFVRLALTVTECLLGLRGMFERILARCHGS